MCVLSTWFLGSATADRLQVVRIPTGSEARARAIASELERVGLGNKFDHGRVQSHIEAMLDPVELQRLAYAGTSPLDLSLFPPSSEWVVVRNMTHQEHGVERNADLMADTKQHHHIHLLHGQQRGPSPESYLPLNRQHYYTVQELEHVLRAFVREYPQVAHMERVGDTTRNAVIWALSITGQSRRHHHGEQGSPESRPTYLFTGSLHGDDMMGTQLCLMLAEYLCQAYIRTPAIRALLDRNRVFIVPMPNPDASYTRRRYTPRGMDMDRGFPDAENHLGDPEPLEREVAAWIEWLEAHQFGFSASFLGGGGGPGRHGLAIRYPYNSEPLTEEKRQELIGEEEKRRRGDGPTPRPRRHHRRMYIQKKILDLDQHLANRAEDDRALRYLARAYASKHAILSHPDPRGNMVDPGAINGAEWYPRYGSLQDWIYIHTSSLHLDLVMSPYLRPLPQHLSSYWNQNQAAILEVLQLLDRHGLRGTVLDAESKRPVHGAEIVLVDRTDRHRQLRPIRTGPAWDGHFARFLVSGHYAMIVSAPGYHTSEQHLFNLNDQNPQHTVDILLQDRSHD